MSREWAAAELRGDWPILNWVDVTSPGCQIVKKSHALWVLAFSRLDVLNLTLL